MAEWFFRKVLKACHNQKHRVITVGKNAAYPKSINKLKAEKALPQRVELRKNKYHNNIVEFLHRKIKRLINCGMEFGCLTQHGER